MWTCWWKATLASVYPNIQTTLFFWIRYTLSFSRCSNHLFFRTTLPYRKHTAKLPQWSPMEGKRPFSLDQTKNLTSYSQYISINGTEWCWVNVADVILILRGDKTRKPQQLYIEWKQKWTLASLPSGGSCIIADMLNVFSSQFPSVTKYSPTITGNNIVKLWVTKTTVVTATDCNKAINGKNHAIFSHYTIRWCPGHTDHTIVINQMKPPAHQQLPSD